MADLNVLLTQSLQAHQRGSLEEARRGYETLLQALPKHGDIHHLYGVLLHQLGKVEQGISSIKRAIELSEDNGVYYTNLCQLLTAMGQLREAADAGRQAVSLTPGDPAAYLNLGTALFQDGCTDEARDSFQKAIALGDIGGQASFNLACLARDAENYAEAVTFAEQASEHLQAPLLLAELRLLQAGSATEIQDLIKQIAALPESEPREKLWAVALCNLGKLTEETGDLAGALSLYQQGVLKDPQHFQLQNNLGNLLNKHGRRQEAVACLERAVALNPEYADAHVNLAMAHFALGHFNAAWAHYPWRFQLAKPVRGGKTMDKPWNGASIEGKRVLILAEQGMGDACFYAGFYNNIISAASECFIECEPRLQPVLQRSFPEAKILARDCDWGAGTELGEVDVQMPAADAVRYGTERLGITSLSAPYLTADPERVQAIREDYAHRFGHQLKVGIAWQTAHRDFQHCNVSLEQWLPAFDIPDIAWVNLQYGECADALKTLKAQTGKVIYQDPAINPLTSMADFAAQVTALDLVITIDNSTSTLALALGVPTWALLTPGCHMIWFTESAHSPWYTRAMLFRQSKLGDWRDVMNAVAAKLKERR